MHILEKIFDWVFPPSEEAVCVRQLSLQNVQTLYAPRVIDDLHTLSSFKEFKIRSLIHESKFHHNQKAHMLLGRLLEVYLRTGKKTFEVIIPIPLSNKRLRERGHNQVTSVLQAIHQINVLLDQHVLKRNRHTIPQTELSKQKRLENVRDAFVVTDGEKVRGKHILLVDDVMTTGATLRAAKASLLPHQPASVTCVALAH